MHYLPGPSLLELLQGAIHFLSRTPAQFVTWDAKNKRPRYLVTNLPRAGFQQIGDAYRLGFQVELMFKEWKSYTSLHAFDTSKANIAEGLIWAALCAAILKRYCAHLAQRLWQVPISTRKVAMCLHHVLSDIFRALMHSQCQLYKPSSALCTSLPGRTTRCA